MRSLDDLEVEKWLEYNAKLQKKKNSLRKVLKEKGILKKDKTNTFDNYRYFSEAQYKSLFTELFSDIGLELKFTEVEYTLFEGTQKQSNGRMPKLAFDLLDVDTGFYETTYITGEGIDKGDKAGYKAYTGALKYYLANTFMVATGDDPEIESPDENMNNKKTVKTASNNNGNLQPTINKSMYDALMELINTKNIPVETITEVLKKYGYSKLTEIKVVDVAKIRNELAKE